MYQVKDILEGSSPRKCTKKDKILQQSPRVCKEAATLLIAEIANTPMKDMVEATFNSIKKQPKKKKGAPKPENLTPEEEPEYFEVDRVIDTKTEGRQRFYYVSWKGYDESEWSWEPLSGLKLAQDAIREFKERIANETTELTHEERKEAERKRLKDLEASGEVKETEKDLEASDEVKETEKRDNVKTEVSNQPEEKGKSRKSERIESSPKKKSKQDLALLDSSATLNGKYWSTPSKTSWRNDVKNENIDTPSTSMSNRDSEFCESENLQLLKEEIVECYRSVPVLSCLNDPFSNDNIEEPIAAPSKQKAEKDREKPKKSEKRPSKMSKVPSTRKRRKKRRNRIIPRELRWHAKKSKFKNLEEVVEKKEMFYEFEEDPNSMNAFDEPDEFDPENSEIVIEFLAHLNSEPSNNDKLECTYCNVSAPDVVSLKKHQALQHFRGVIYKCPICGAEYNWNKNFYEHVALHFEGFSYKCESCEHNTEKIHEYLSHRITHTFEKIHNCKECDFQCLFHQNLIVHRRIHSDEKPFECQVCHMKFSIKSILLQHEQNHLRERKPRTTRIFTCPTCDIGFKKFALYIEHYQNRHPDEPEPKNFKCTFCRRPFNYKETRRVHEELHKQNRIFYCEECKCSIKNQASYKVHLEAHNGEEIVCVKCSFIEDKVKRYMYHKEKCLAGKENKINVHISSNCVAFKEQPQDATMQSTSADMSLQEEAQESKPAKYRCDLCDLNTDFFVVYQRHMKRRHKTNITSTSVTSVPISSALKTNVTDDQIARIRQQDDQPNSENIEQLDQKVPVTVVSFQIPEAIITSKRQANNLQKSLSSTNSATTSVTPTDTIMQSLIDHDYTCLTTNNDNQTRRKSLSPTTYQVPCQTNIPEYSNSSTSAATVAPNVLVPSLSNLLTSSSSPKRKKVLRSVVTKPNTAKKQRSRPSKPIVQVRPVSSTPGSTSQIQAVSNTRCHQCAGCLVQENCGICTGCINPSKAIGCIMKICQTKLEHDLRTMSLNFKKRIGCNNCDVCNSNGCQTCFVCLDKRFFGNYFLAGALCLERECLKMVMTAPSQAYSTMHNNYGQHMNIQMPSTSRLQTPISNAYASQNYMATRAPILGSQQVLGPAMSTSAITQYPVNITPASSFSVPNTTAYTPSSLIVSSQNLNFGAQQMANTPNHYVPNTLREPINPTLNLVNSSTSATSSNPTSSDPNTPVPTSRLIVKLEPQENLSELLSKEYKLVCEALETLPLWIPAQNSAVVVLKGHVYNTPEAIQNAPFTNLWQCYQRPLCQGTIQINESILQLLDKCEPKIAYKEVLEHNHFNDSTVAFSAIARYIVNRWALKNENLTAEELRDAILTITPQGAFVPSVQIIAKELETLRTTGRNYFIEVDQKNWRIFKNIEHST